MPSSDLNEYIAQLLTEAGELKKDFVRGGTHSWYRYSPSHLGYALWKQRVLQVLRSFGEQNPYYTDLLTIEKDYSSSRPASVFSFFMETLKKTAQFNQNGGSWSAITAPPPPTKEMERKSPVIEPENDSNQTPQSPAQTLADYSPAEIPETETNTSPEKTTAPLNGEEQGINKKPPKMTFKQLDLEARAIYGHLFIESKDLIDKSDKPPTEKYPDITTLCALTRETLKTNPRLLSCAVFSSAENYLYAHTANVTILSQAIALESGLSSNDMDLLSFCAMTHDLGMTGFQELYSKKELLTDTDFSRIALHSESGAAKVDNMTGMDPVLRERAKKIIWQIHERADTSGYPLMLSGKEIDPLAQIIGVSDIYEALTHPRGWREAFHPNEAIRQLIREGARKFDIDILKSIIRVLSIYPPSSLVELSNGEIACVLAPTQGSLTKPLVEILLDANFTPVQKYVIDLKEQSITHITRPVFQDELEENNPEFAAHLKSEGWWKEPVTQSFTQN